MQMSMSSSQGIKPLCLTCPIKVPESSHHLNLYCFIIREKCFKIAASDFCTKDKTPEAAGTLETLTVAFMRFSKKFNRSRQVSNFD